MLGLEVGDRVKVKKGTELVRTTPGNNYPTYCEIYGTVTVFDTDYEGNLVIVIAPDYATGEYRVSGTSVLEEV